MAALPSEPILLRDLPNDAMYVVREWWEYMRDQDHKLRSLRACLRALMREHPEAIPVEEILKLGVDQQ